MKIFVYISVLLCLTSCLTESKIRRNCDKFASICGTQQTTTIYKDTTVTIRDTVEVPLPPDTVVVSGDVNVVNNVANFKPVYVEGNMIATYVEIKNNKLFVRSTIIKKTIPYVINMNITLPDAIRETNTINTVKVKYIPGFYKFAFWYTISTILLIVFISLAKLKIFNLVTWIKLLLKL